MKLAEEKANARPHPGPLPQERENRSAVAGGFGATLLDWRPKAKCKIAGIAPSAKEFQKRFHCCSLSPGERVRVAASVTTNLISFVGLAFFLTAFRPALFASETAVTDTSVSPYAVVRSIGLGEVHWTRGFWADKFELCRTQMIPSMERLMEGTNYSQFFRNFQIAAGLVEGKRRGATFNDGDFLKWLEGAAASLAVTNDPELSNRLDDIISVIAKAQRADGYLDTSVLIRARNGDTNAQPFKEPTNFEIYNMGHLLTAACVHHRVTGKTNLLAVAQKTADFLCEVFRKPTPELARNDVCPSHYMGIVELYRVTHESRYLELAKTFFSMRDLVKDGGSDNQDRIPFKGQAEAEGHAARANYLYAGAADLFLETGDMNLWKPLEKIWTNVVEEKMYITGGCGALYDGASPDGAKNQKGIARVHQSYGRDYQLPNFTAHNETCANIGNALWNWRMFLATGEARFMDVVELELYNSVLSGVGLDGTNFFYVNPLRSFEAMPVELRWSNKRVPFVGSFCCPPNVVRSVAEVADYAYGKSDGSIWVNLYGDSTLATKLSDGGAVKLTQETEYPWSGRVRIKFEECNGKEFALKLRIPGWAKSASVRINNRPADTSATPGTYFEVRHAWKPGDFVDLDLPMPAQVMTANPFVEETFNQVAVKRGPIVYCLESTDLPHGTRTLDVMIPENIKLAARFDQRLLGGVAVLEGKALCRTNENWSGPLYREMRPAADSPVNLRLIPYFVWGNRGPSDMTVWMLRGG
jgi:DUF1680 family protein